MKMKSLGKEDKICSLNYGAPKCVTFSSVATNKKREAHESKEVWKRWLNKIQLIFGVRPEILAPHSLRIIV